MLNNSNLIGRLVRDVELNNTPQKKPVANFTIAVNRNYKNRQGERKTDFISCVMWEEKAKNFAKWTQKGSLVRVSGQLESRDYTDSQNIKRYVTELNVQEFDLLDDRDKTAATDGVGN